jgi:hypothetical protein
MFFKHKICCSQVFTIRTIIALKKTFQKNFHASSCFQKEGFFFKLFNTWRFSFNII